MKSAGTRYAGSFPLARVAERFNVSSAGSNRRVVVVMIASFVLGMAVALAVYLSWVSHAANLSACGAYSLPAVHFVVRHRRRAGFCLRGRAGGGNHHLRQRMFVCGRGRGGLCGGYAASDTRKEGLTTEHRGFLSISFSPCPLCLRGEWFFLIFTLPAAAGSCNAGRPVPR